MTSRASFSRHQIEAGRKLFASAWDFAAGTDTLRSMPRATGVEIAFAGRSNVGKSSLINALTGRKALARTSRTPGRTQQINFFKSDSDLVLADLPGYGFAAAAKDKVDRWTGLVHDYLCGRPNLARVYVLIDSRHGLKPQDREVLGYLDRAGVSYAIVLTKIDTMKAQFGEPRILETEAAIKNRPAAFPTVFPVSSFATTGIAELRAAIARLLAERATSH
jgi:GTP-binding protein